MKRYQQLTRLLWDYYRENAIDLQRLRPLACCKLVRRWGVLCIHCPNPELAESVVAAQALLEAPVKQLRLAQKIKIFVGKNSIAVYSVPQRQVA